MRELPPTAGMPLIWSDFFHAGERLEDGLSRFLSIPISAVLSSGTASLVVALETLKRLHPERKQVIIPGYTCPLVALAAAQAGLKIIVCDLLPDSIDLDPNQLRSLLNKETLAVIPAHLGGLPCDLTTVVKLARANGAKVIEDCAQALGATIKGRSIGLAGDIGIFSLTVGKGLSIYEGGFIIAREERMRAALCETLESMNLHATGAQYEYSFSPEELNMLGHLIGYRILYNPGGLSIVYGDNLKKELKAGNVEAAIGDVFPREIAVRPVGELRKNIGASALKRLPQFLADNRARGLARAQKLSAYAERGLKILQPQQNTDGTWPFLMLLFEDEATCNQALDRLWTRGLGVTRLFASQINGYSYLADILPDNPVPNAASFARRCLTISNSVMVQDRDFDKILSAIEPLLKTVGQKQGDADLVSRT
ncbi:MAG: DegT/DnrJ/EryC1/StrS family aminotransferase [Cyanobacteriota/Melainabacteria group bacterium]